jgi:hypothetical protein
LVSTSSELIKRRWRLQKKKLSVADPFQPETGHQGMKPGTVAAGLPQPAPRDHLGNDGQQQHLLRPAATAAFQDIPALKLVAVKAT